jgi:uncharacterized protein
MANQETVQCPGCQGVNVDRSQWRSRDEKRSYAGFRPVRCRDCGHRFLIPVWSKGRIGVAWLGGGVLLAMLLGVVGFSLWPKPPAPAAVVPEPAAVSTAITPLAMAAAEGGDPEAQYAVATSMLADSDLNMAYASKAIAFLQQAAERGHARAMLRLGILYRKGVEAPQNYALAAKWIEKAALLGESQAMVEFARLNREGIGMPMDLVKAYIWLNRAAAARDSDAPRERAEVARHLTPSELQRAQDESTTSHFEQAAVAPGPVGPHATSAPLAIPPAER